MLSNRQLQKFEIASWFARAACLCLAVAVGCARSQYSKEADQEAYCLISSRQSSPLWDIPAQTVEPQTLSRMRVPGHRDCYLQPEDDPAAHCYMRHPYCINNARYYDKIGVRQGSENPIWLDSLPRDELGNIKLTQDLALQLALLHSRDYQRNYETVYLNALVLSNNRFEFDTQWFWGLGSGFFASGDDLGRARDYDVNHVLGFSRSLAGGGQFATSLANSLFWDFGSGGVDTGSAALVSTFTQPLLRGAFRFVRLEDLTQSERNLLYSVRDFARFRRTFYSNVASDYLSLLTQVQALRNVNVNVENLRQNLDEHQLLVSLGMVSDIQASQVFLQYQNARTRVLASEQALINSLDQFKFLMGIPPWVPLELDESPLEAFEFVSPDLLRLQADVQELLSQLVQFLPPTIAPISELDDGYRQFVDLHEQVAQLVPGIQEELQQWQSRVQSIDADALGTDDRLDFDQQVILLEDITSLLEDVVSAVEGRAKLHQEVRAAMDEALSGTAESTDEQPVNADNEGESSDSGAEPSLQDEPPEIQAWEILQQAIGQQLREQIADLYVAQTQIRLFLIDIDPYRFDQHAAVTYAHYNRLDLKNQKASVMDAFRKVEVAADALESDLSVSGTVAVGSDGGKNNAFSFDSANNTYRLGMQFDGPLNRLNERNAYRASQVLYQREFRAYLASKDQIANEVRSILRRLELSRLNFQIARQQLVAATKQVDQAQVFIRRSMEADSNLTLFLLDALQGLLDAKNNLIGNWIAYRQLKLQLFVALEMLYLDEQGNWLNEESGLSEIAAFRMIDPEYFPPDWVSPELDSPPTGAERGSEVPLEIIETPPAESLESDALILPVVSVAQPDEPPTTVSEALPINPN